MRKQIKKAQTIAKAFTQPLPKGEDWYEKRVSICDTCEYNTKNMKEDEFSDEDRLKLKLHICPEGDHCTACGCCTHRKASQKIEECGLADIGETPKWPALSVESEIDRKIITENLTPDVGELKIYDKEFVYDLGESSQDKIDFSIKMHRKGGFDLKNVEIGCTCTYGEPVKVDSNSYIFNMSISTLKFREGQNVTRKFTVEYFTGLKKPKTIIVKIKLKKG